MFSPSGPPVTVSTSLCMRPMPSSTFITAGRPPASFRSTMKCSPAGFIFTMWGTLSLISFTCRRSSESPASWAMAGRWRMVLVEQPMAMSSVRALLTALSVITSRGRRPRSTSSIIFMPVCLARRTRSAMTAGMVPFPGRAMPRASVMQFMELAVNSPAQLPQPGQDCSSISRAVASSMRPASTAPGASKAPVRAILCPQTLPGSMGPPDTKMAGRFSRRAAMSIPGTILSQLGMNTSPSKGWAVAIISTESAMCSRLGREKNMPSWFMAMPSHTPMLGNSTGVPPAMRMPSSTARATVSRCMCPGMISLLELTTPMMGRASSSSVRPRALNRALCGMRVVPVFIRSLLINFPPVCKGILTALS